MNYAVFLRVIFTVLTVQNLICAKMLTFRDSDTIFGYLVNIH
jgi:hypothetical protein